MKKERIIVVLSGGMDSITMLHHYIDLGYELKAISFNYGQRHSKELDMAKENCKLLDIEHKIINIEFLANLINNSALTGDIDVPEGHYEDENMKLTVVPNRNMILGSIAIGWAVNEKFNNIAMGVHAGDHEIYPDCRKEFIDAFTKVSMIANYDGVKVLAPFQDITKIEILERGLEIGVDYSKTWTCYKGLDKACGKCGSCQERLEAFAKNNQTDPLEYE